MILILALYAAKISEKNILTPIMILPLRFNIVHLSKKHNIQWIASLEIKSEIWKHFTNIGKYPVHLVYIQWRESIVGYPGPRGTFDLCWCALCAGVCFEPKGYHPVFINNTHKAQGRPWNNMASSRCTYPHGRYCSNLSASRSWQSGNDGLKTPHRIGPIWARKSPGLSCRGKGVYPRPWNEPGTKGPVFSTEPANMDVFIEHCLPTFQVNLHIK